MNRRSTLLGVGALLPLAACALLPPRFPETFEVAWTEDVQLSDAQVIPVKVRRKFRRLDRDSEFKLAILRGTEVTFDAGPSIGAYTFEVDRNIAMIDRSNGVWYFLISTDLHKYHPFPGIVQSNLKLVHLEGRQIVGNTSSRDLPKEFKELNLMHLTIVDDMAKYDGRHMTLKDKEDYRKRHNTSGINLQIYPTQCARNGTC